VKVVHVVLGLNMGGLERVVLRLVARTDRARFEPVVCALDEPGVLAPELARLDVPLRIVRREPGLDTSLPFRLGHWLKEQGARIVHTHNPAPHLYGSLAARIAGARVIHTKHGRNTPSVRRYVLLNRIAASMTDRLVAVSDDAARVAIEIEHVSAHKVVTVLNGVDTDLFRPGGDARAARARLGIPAEGFHVGCVARLCSVKDHATLLDAFARVRRARPDAHLTLVGDGEERARLEATRARLGLEEAVTFAGQRTDTADLYAAFDVFALSSSSEGIPLTLLEAAAAGLPSVATRVGGNAEVVVDGETGLLVPPRDPERFSEALLALAARQDRAAMGAAARARVDQRFSAERMSRAYHDLYTEILSPDSRARPIETERDRAA